MPNEYTITDGTGPLDIENAVLTELLSNDGSQVLLDFFLTSATVEEGPYSKARLKRETGVARQTVFDNVDVLVEYGIVEDVGNTQSRYQPAVDADIYQTLVEVNRTLTDIGGGRGTVDVEE